MLGRIEKILYNIPLNDLKDGYTYLFGECCIELTRKDYVQHFVDYIHIYLKNHKLNENMIVKSIIIFNFLNYMEEKYNIR